MRVTATLVCENVLQDLEARTTLHNVLPVFRANAFPAEASFVVVSFVLVEEGDQPGTLRVAVVDPGGNLIGEATAAIPVTLSPGMQFVQISRFAGIVFPSPGLYRVENKMNGEIVSLPFGVFEEGGAQ